MAHFAIRASVLPPRVVVDSDMSDFFIWFICLPVLCPDCIRNQTSPEGSLAMAQNDIV